MAAASNIGQQGDAPRRAVPWYRLPDPSSAYCPHCHIPCICNGTQSHGGYKTQYRRCPKCGHTLQTSAR